MRGCQGFSFPFTNRFKRQGKRTGSLLRENVSRRESAELLPEMPPSSLVMFDEENVCCSFGRLHAKVSPLLETWKLQKAMTWTGMVVLLDALLFAILVFCFLEKVDKLCMRQSLSPENSQYPSGASSSAS